MVGCWSQGLRVVLRAVTKSRGFGIVSKEGGTVFKKAERTFFKRRDEAAEENQEEGSPASIELLLATLFTATPSLRAKFFANPTKQVGKQLPPPEYWTYSTDDAKRKLERAQLARGVLLEIAKRVREGELSSTVNTDSIFEDYFAPIVRVSQRSFNATFVLSIGAFIAGLGLIGSGVYIALYSPAGTNSTIVGSIFGGGGAISALGSVYAMAQSGIREATSDHARLRVVLTGFATELGQLRSLAEGEEPPLDSELGSVNRINLEIRESMGDALKGLMSSTRTDGTDATSSD